MLMVCQLCNGEMVLKYIDGTLDFDVQQVLVILLLQRQ